MGERRAELGGDLGRGVPGLLELADPLGHGGEALVALPGGQDLVLFHAGSSAFSTG